MADSIRIHDLCSPVLSSIQLEALRIAEENPVSLTKDTILAAARHESQLDDFGSRDFEERLQYWLDDTASDPNRTALSRTGVFNRCVRYATTRLRLRQLLSQHPEIHEIKIVRPIIVVGPFRSGSTHLVNLLATDVRLHSVPLWESYDPIPANTDFVSPIGGDPRLAKCVQNKENEAAILPLFSAMRPVGPKDVDEETELQGPDFPVHWWKSISLVRSDDYYELDGSDATSHYEYMKTMLKALQWHRGPGRWVLKSVHHCEQIGPLLNSFPDATIVMTHRDPVSIVKSVATLASYLARIEYHRIDTMTILTYWTKRIETLLRTMIRDRSLIPKEQLVDVKFHEFMSNSLDTVEQVLSIAGLAPEDGQRDRIRTYLANHPSGRHGRILYDLQRNFGGVRSEEIQDLFSFYRDAFRLGIDSA